MDVQEEEVECSRCFRLVEKIIYDKKHLPLCEECFPMVHPEILMQMLHEA